MASVSDSAISFHPEEIALGTSGSNFIDNRQGGYRYDILRNHIPARRPSP